MKLSSFAFLFASCLSMSTASAGIISYNGYSLDEESNIVVGGGLEWLQWDETNGKALDAVLLDSSYSGWRLATRFEMVNLFNAFDFGFTYTADSTTNQIVRPPFTVDEEINSFKKFTTLFGNTNEALTIDWDTDPLEASQAFYGEDDNGDGLFDLAVVYDDFTYDTSLGPATNQAYASLLVNRSSSTGSNGATGIALVRAASVPEPGTLALMGLGLLGMIRLRRTLCRLGARR